MSSDPAPKKQKTAAAAVQVGDKVPSIIVDYRFGDDQEKVRAALHPRYNLPATIHLRASLFPPCGTSQLRRGTIPAQVATCLAEQWQLASCTLMQTPLMKESWQKPCMHLHQIYQFHFRLKYRHRCENYNDLILLS